MYEQTFENMYQSISQIDKKSAYKWQEKCDGFSLFYVDLILWLIIQLLTCIKIFDVNSPLINMYYWGFQYFQKHVMKKYIIVEKQMLQNELEALFWVSCISGVAEKIKRLKRNW